MLIVCPNCQASYRVSAESLGSAGRTVRCAKCNTAWFADAETAHEDAKTIGMLPSEIDRSELTERPEAAVTSAVAALPSEDVPVGKPRRAMPRLSFSSRKPKSAAVWAGLGMVFIGALVFARASVVSLLPETASLYAAIGLDVNIRGLSFRDVEATERVENGVPVLLISGNIENITGTTIDVPRLRLAVRNLEGRELYVWTAVPRQNRLVAGASLPFQAQLAVPPAESQDIAVRFLARHDAVAGIN